MTLLIWLSVQGLCFAHCNFGLSQATSAGNEAKQVSQSGCCSKTENKDQPAGKTPPSASCLTLKQAVFAGKHFEFVPPELPAAPEMLSVFLNSVATEKTDRALPRQRFLERRLFTLEVCLGPTFLSIPPPSLA